MRRIALGLLLATLAGGPARAAEPAPEGRAFVEVTASRDPVFVGERFRLTLRIGVDAEYFREHAAPLSRQRLDVPVQVVAPWTSGLDGAAPSPKGPVEPAGARPRVRIAVNDDAEEAAEGDAVVRDGRPFRVLTVERAYRPTAAGDLPVAAPTLRFAYATRFEEDFVNGRVAVDRHDVTVPGSPLVLHVRALPEAGRPAEFHGAVGRFAVSAQADRSAVAVGETLRLTLRIQGDGDLETPEAPRPEEGRDFHVYGAVDDHGRDRRTVAYDLAPLRASVTEVPSIPFAFFDPGPPAGYRVVRTERLPLRVSPRPGTAATDGGDADVGPKRSGPPLWTLVAGLGALGAIGVLVASRRLARRRAPADPALARTRAAAIALRSRLLAGDPSPADALAGFLAAVTGCSPAAVISPDLAARLRDAGVPPPIADRAAGTLERLVAARYGGGSAGVGSAEIADLARAIEAAFEASRRTGDGSGRP